MRASPIELRHRRVDHAAYRQCRSVGNFARGPKRAIVVCAARTRDGQGAGIRTVRSHRSTAARGRMREKRFASASERALTIGGITAHEIRLWGRVSGRWTHHVAVRASMFQYMPDAPGAADGSVVSRYNRVCSDTTRSASRHVTRSTATVFGRGVGGDS